MPKPKHQRHTESDVSDMTYDNDRGNALFNDIVLIVEGKTIHANAGIMAYNSEVFAKMIESARKRKDDEEFENFSDVLDKGGDQVEVFLPGQSYSTVKTLMNFLQTKYSKAENLSGDTAIQLLPLTNKYKMSRLRKTCSAAILEELENLKRANKSNGGVPAHVVLRYLAAADSYNLRKVRAFCIEEYTEKFGASQRKEIMDDEHISEKTKVEIMDNMYARMTDVYEKKIRKLENDMKRRYKEIDDKRQEDVEATESWKKEFKDETDDIIKDFKKSYDDFVSKLERTTKFIDELADEITILKEEVIGAIENMNTKVATLKEKVNGATETMNTNVSIYEKEISLFKQTVGDAYTRSTEHMKTISVNVTKYIKDSIKRMETDEFKTSLTENYELKDKMDAISVEFENNLQALNEAEAKYEREKVLHENTKTQLRKHMKKVHQINTWLKWAKPIDDDENRCTCFRHANLKKSINF